MLAILSKEQYLILAAPICLTLVLASADRARADGRGVRGGSLRGWIGRYRTRQAAAATTVAMVLAAAAGGYVLWDQTSP